MAQSDAYGNAVAVTPSDGTSYTFGIADALYVGGAGIAQVVLPNGSVVAFTVVAGQTLPVRHIRVNATSTTATLMVALRN